MVRAVFLDRDGVINANMERDGRPVAPTCLAEFYILAGVEHATRRLKAAGFLLVVVTNQPDVANGLTPKAIVEAMHTKVRSRLPVDDVAVCYHADGDDCACHKPKPGMIFNAAQKHGIDLAASYLVGDRWRDVQAGRAAGCHTIFVDYGYPQDQPTTPDNSRDKG
jgi:D-glycero-D-manno-heptose 1,7-bisphosphate phosphatase